MKGGRLAKCSRLLVLTGEASEVQKISKVFHTREAENFVRLQLADDWNAINPESTITNVAEQGFGIDRRAFETEIQVVVKDYELEQVTD